MDNKYSFLPGAWWIKEGGEKNQQGCNGFQAKLRSGVNSLGVDQLLSTCLGVTHNPARTEAYEKALKAVKC
ncbi:hypothetical protein DSO57_1007156 [Entomophthora muscae]|uniref:Uncharacterized protein n=1 Tax=Entomophthora muscae TaxID=34485 RepID=A0ACC2U5T5_9FUNG|nr:hypothetical protein DSO57_1007156 [Entomophthora muscae]